LSTSTASGPTTAAVWIVSSLAFRTISVTGSCTVIETSIEPSNVGAAGSSRSSIA
jgi:hypothetical protein